MNGERTKKVLLMAFKSCAEIGTAIRPVYEIYRQQFWLFLD